MFTPAVYRDEHEAKLHAKLITGRRSMRTQCTDGMVFLRVEAREHPMQASWVLAEIWRYRDAPEFGEFCTGLLPAGDYRLVEIGAV